MLQLLLSPRRGWEDIAVDDDSDMRLLRYGYVPLIIIAALSSLAALLYHAEASAVIVIERMIACFVRFLVSYYIASFCFSLYIPSCTGGEMSMHKNNTFILYAMGLLAVLNILTNMLPMVPDMLYLLPIYVFFIMWCGINYMEVVFDGVIGFMVLSLMSVIVPPFLLQYLFNLIIPQ